MKKFRSCFLFRITTTAGISGWGECDDWLPALEKGFRQRIIPFLKGKSVADRKKIIEVIGNWHQRAAAGVSMALTEIVAKQADLSVSELWGGLWREKVPVYASFQSYSEDLNWVKRSIQLLENSVKQGFTQAKLKIGGRPIREDQQHISSVQNHFAGSLHLALDANQSYDAAAVSLWQPFFTQWDNLLWLEEPIPMHRQRQYLQLKNWLSLPVSGGENLSTQQFLPLLTEGSIDILQPDPMHHKSLDDYFLSLTMARQFGLRSSPHTFDGSLSRLYALFAQACLPPWSKMTGEEIEPVEWDAMDNPFTELFPLKPVNGQVQIPNGKGIGIEVDWELLQAYRWDGSSYTS